MGVDLILNKEVTFRTITKGNDRPSNHGQNKDSVNDMQVTVNATYISAQTSIQGFGISNAKMVIIRSITPLPDFDIVVIDGFKFKLYASQSVVDRRNITLIEVDA